ncbi:SAM-dependent methyltransferase [Pandoraea communis]|uniref:SAM-dependent methyltransferase n=1 Tax=Pandoraea communis TaxID=2508297 RepID=A0A5E4V6Z2_9BURK|nr:SAM-dependent methyltransferase [Pandoraea communis]
MAQNIYGNPEFFAGYRQLPPVADMASGTGVFCLGSVAVKCGSPSRGWVRLPYLTRMPGFAPSCGSRM